MSEVSQSKPRVAYEKTQKRKEEKGENKKRRNIFQNCEYSAILADNDSDINIQPIDLAIVQYCSNLPKDKNFNSHASFKKVPIQNLPEPVSANNSAIITADNKNLNKKAQADSNQNFHNTCKSNERNKNSRNFVMQNRQLNNNNLLGRMLTKNDVFVLSVLSVISLFLILSSFIVNSDENITKFANNVYTDVLHIEPEIKIYSVSNPAFEYIYEDIPLHTKSVKEDITEVKSEEIKIVPPDYADYTETEKTEEAQEIHKAKETQEIQEEVQKVQKTEEVKEVQEPKLEQAKKATVITTEVFEKFEELDFTTKIVETDSIKKGTTQIIKSGVPGKIVRYYERIIENGEIKEENFLREKIVTEPVAEVVYKGIGGTIQGADGTMYSYSHVIDVEALAYGDVSEGKNPNWTGITYTGIECRPGIIAVDPNVIPLHSKIYVKGNYGDYGVCYAADTGAGIKGNMIDIFMESKEEMIKFGRRQMKVYILD